MTQCYDQKLVNKELVQLKAGNTGNVRIQFTRINHCYMYKKSIGQFINCWHFNVRKVLSKQQYLKVILITFHTYIYNKRKKGEKWTWFWNLACLLTQSLCNQSRNFKFTMHAQITAPGWRFAMSCLWFCFNDCMLFYCSRSDLSKYRVRRGLTFGTE